MPASAFDLVADGRQDGEHEAFALRLTQLTAHASLFAKPFFKKRGWVIENHETIIRGGVEIPRAKMSKLLLSSPLS